jgi:serine/threonine-protein kinase
MALLAEGQKIGGTFEVEKLLGEGAFAEVYRVKHKFLGRQALKILKQPGVTETDIKAMLKEASLLSQIGHKNIIRVFDANTVLADGHERGYFTMEYVGTGTLADFMDSFSQGLVPAEKSVEIVAQIAEGLNVAHNQKPAIIHRDLKPQNILVQEDADGLKVKISDFGLAQEVNPLTFMTAAAGTLSFKAPEAVFEGGIDSRASDIWSLGVILYVLLTERLPYPAPTQWGWSNKAFQQPHRPPSAFNVDANEALDSIVKKCLRLEPHQRYSKTSTLLNDLRRWKPTQRRATGVPSQVSIPQTFSAERRSDDAQPNTDAHALLQAALTLANEQRLEEAADKLEAAIQLQPSLRNPHAQRIALWRRGLSS